MQTTTHTPGPWTIESNDVHGDTVSVVRDGVRSKIAGTNDLWLCDEHGGTAAANARLIAAAPNMLDALRELVAEWDALHADEDHRTGYTLDTEGISKARAALASL